MEPLPDAGLAPVAEPPPAAHAAAVAHYLREAHPVDTGLEYEDDAGQVLAILVRGPSGPIGPLELLAGRQPGVDLAPQYVGYDGLCHGYVSIKGDGHDVRTWHASWPILLGPLTRDTATSGGPAAYRVVLLL